VSPPYWKVDALGARAGGARFRGQAPMPGAVEMRVQRALLTSAVASMFALGAAHAQQQAPQGKEQKQTEKTVKCAGINACQGKSACASAKNACAGKNACKGQGLKEVKSEQECKAQGGTVQTAKR
jgi:uncharacterized membrane protein